MRRSERERIDSAFTDAVLRDAFFMTIAFNTGGAPYVLPFNFVYTNGGIYIHCAREGRKISLLRGGLDRVQKTDCVSHAGITDCADEASSHPKKNQSGTNIGFNAVADHPFTEGTTTRYRSVCGTGIVYFVEDTEEKTAVLHALADKYNAPCKFPISEAKLNATQIVRIDIVEICGKHSHAAEGPRPVHHYVE